MLSTFGKHQDFLTYMRLTKYQIFDIPKMLSYVGGLWTAIAVVFGAIINSFLVRNFWNNLAREMLKKEEEKDA